MNNLLVVVDMVEGFINQGALADKNINRIVPNIEALISKAIYQGDKVIAFIDTHKKDDVEFEKYPPHCIEGTSECDLVPELRKYKDYMFLIPKNTTNGFNTKQFKRLVTLNKFSEIKVCGCCTDICVKDFTESLLKYNHIVGASTIVKVMSDACDTFNAPNHNADEINKKTFKELQTKGATISSSTKQKDR